MARLTGDSLFIDSRRKPRRSGEDGARAADSTGPRLFRVKTARPGAPERPQRARFGLGLPAPISVQASEKRKRAPEGAAGRFLGAGMKKTSEKDPLGTRLEML